MTSSGCKSSVGLMVASILILANLQSVSNVEASSDSDLEEWKIAFTVGKFLYSKEPDKIFKVYYKVINGTIEKLTIVNTGVSSTGNGTLEIMFPRNYPYTNEEGATLPNAESPILFSDGKPYDEPVTLSDTTDCFFVFSIPFTGNRRMGLAWAYLLNGAPYHGDNIPDDCNSQTMVEDVPVRKDGTITPLQQFKSGVAAEDAMCPTREEVEENLLLLISPKGKPYCVRWSDEGFMKRHGWTEPQ